MRLFDEYLATLQERDEEWWNLVQWKAGIGALTDYRRKKILHELFTGRTHRSFPQRPDQPTVDHSR
jgi:hypothetical protein